MPVVNPWDRRADWDLWLAVIPRVSYHTLLAWEKIETPSTISIKCISLLYHHKVETL